MKIAGWLGMLSLGLPVVAHGRGQAKLSQSVEPVVSTTFTVQGTSTEREQVVRNQIQMMQPAVLPYRILFVPHWQYVYAVRMYHLHVPTGMTSKMFTHLPSRSVYIDTDRYGGEDWLGHWLAHELGHLERDNADEREAEKAAETYRKRLASARQAQPALRQVLE